MDKWAPYIFPSSQASDLNQGEGTTKVIDF